MADVMERMTLLFPDGAKTASEKIHLFFDATQQPSTELGQNSIRTKLGMARVLACFMVAVPAAEGWLTPMEVDSIRSVLATFSVIHCSWDNQRDSGSLFAAIAAKHGRGLTQRVDPDMLLEMFAPIVAERKAKEPMVLLTESEWLDRVINSYNDSQVATGLKISPQERAAAHTLTRAGPEARSIVRSCWNSFKLAESPITLDMLTSHHGNNGPVEFGIMVQELPHGVDDAEWKSALTLSEQGYSMWLQRSREYYLTKYNILRNTRKKGQVNLRQSCKEMRENQPKVSVALCQWWAYNEIGLRRWARNCVEYQNDIDIQVVALEIGVDLRRGPIA